MSGDFCVQFATRLPDWSAGGLLRCNAAHLSVCRVVLRIPRARHARLVADILARMLRGKCCRGMSALCGYILHQFTRQHERWLARRCQRLLLRLHCCCCCCCCTPRRARDAGRITAAPSTHKMDPRSTIQTLLALKAQSSGLSSFNYRTPTMHRSTCYNSTVLNIVSNIAGHVALVF